MQATAQLIRDEAALFLGRRPTDEEMEWALPRAQKKLAWILEREGDAGGIRQQPWYIGKLVEEVIIEEEFSQYTLARCMEIEAQRQAAATGEIEKGPPLRDDPTTPPLYPGEMRFVNPSKNHKTRRMTNEVINIEA
jgi:hypothetical protein